ncbi:MAG: LysR family transcriptional regulator [Bryobacteraceae bacterium]|jgi:DNA-binding transcriptional LysR family regulator
MTFENLLLFRDIVQERSVSRGAALNGVSQPAASQHLRELEERMGVTLLDRSTRPFTLTAAGKIYFQMCRDALQRYEEFQVALEGLKAEVEGTVRIASIYSVGISEMSRLKEEFSRRFPQAALEVEYLRPDKVYDAVLADRADLGFVSYPQASRLLAVIPFRTEQMAVAAAPSHPLARRAVVKLGDLEGCDFIAFDEDLPIRQGIDRFLRDHGVAVNFAMHFDNLQMIKEAVALGSGISILPVRPLRAEIERGRLVAIPIDAELLRPIGIIHRRRKKLHRAAQCFLDLLDLQPEPAEPVAAK